MRSRPPSGHHFSANVSLSNLVTRFHLKTLSNIATAWLVIGNMYLAFVPTWSAELLKPLDLCNESKKGVVYYMSE